MGAGMAAAGDSGEAQVPTQIWLLREAAARGVGQLLLDATIAAAEAGAPPTTKQGKLGRGVGLGAGSGVGWDIFSLRLIPPH